MTCRSCNRMGAAPLATTVTAFPCGDVWAVAQKNPTLWNTTHYHLCLATHKAGQLALDAGHWVWNELRALWQALKNVAVRVMRGAAQVLAGVLQGAKNLLQWLDNQAAHALNWIMWAAIGVGGFILAHDYLKGRQKVIVQQAPPAAKAA